MEPTPDDRVEADGWSFVNRPVEPDREVGTPIYDQLVDETAQRQPAPPARPVAMPGPDGDPKVGTP